MATPTAIDWARLAAYIDGEGCIQLNRGKQSSKKAKPHWRPTYITQVVVTNTDPRLVVWCRDNFGGFIVRYVQGSRPCFKWYCHTKACVEVLTNCLPYFIIKRRQAEIAIAFRSTYSKEYIGRGRKVPDEVIAQRESLMAELGVERAERPEFLN